LDELAEWKFSNNIADDLTDSSNKEQDNIGDRGQRVASRVASGKIKSSSAAAKNILFLIFFRFF
jgi:hypothetical protein